MIRRDRDSRQELPIVGAAVTAWDGVTSSTAQSDASGYFKLTFHERVWPDEEANLSFRHPDYQPLDLKLQIGLRSDRKKLYVAALEPKSPQADLSGPRCHREQWLSQRPLGVQSFHKSRDMGRRKQHCSLHHVGVRPAWPLRHIGIVCFRKYPRGAQWGKLDRRRRQSLALWRLRFDAIGSRLPQRPLGVQSFRDSMGLDRWNQHGRRYRVGVGTVWGVRLSGIAAPGNHPGARSSAATWTDSGGNLWLYGGYGYDGGGNFGFLNDLWEYSLSPTANGPESRSSALPLAPTPPRRR